MRHGGVPVFQSTLPARGATQSASAFQSGQRYFNPRSPHGERPQYVLDCVPIPQFQSTLPARGATAADADVRHFAHISIHAPRTGSDAAQSIMRARGGYISIHAPRTGSDGRSSMLWSPSSTRISIHAPRTGSDVGPNGGIPTPLVFQSTLPARGATTT